VPIYILQILSRICLVNCEFCTVSQLLQLLGSFLLTSPYRVQAAGSQPKLAPPTSFRAAPHDTRRWIMDDYGRGAEGVLHE
jgi:hypothetical protein